MKRLLKLPPRPKFNDDDFRQKKGTFLIDNEIDSLIRKGKLHLKGPGTSNPYYWMRRSAVIAGMAALRDAKLQLEKSDAIRREAVHICKNGRSLICLLDRFKTIVRFSEKTLSGIPRINDPTFLIERAARQLELEKLKQVVDCFDLGADQLKELLEEMSTSSLRNRGNTDVLMHNFITNLRWVWHLATGFHPATAASGPFVRFAQGAWTMLGWDDCCPHVSFGRRIAKQAMRENWSLSRAMKQSCDRE